MPTWRVRYSETYTDPQTDASVKVIVEARVEAATEALATQAIDRNLAASGQVQEISRDPAPQRHVLDVNPLS